MFECKNILIKHMEIMLLKFQFNMCVNKLHLAKMCEFYDQIKLEPDRANVIKLNTSQMFDMKLEYILNK